MGFKLVPSHPEVEHNIGGWYSRTLTSLLEEQGGLMHNEIVSSKYELGKGNKSDTTIYNMLFGDWLEAGSPQEKFKREAATTMFNKAQTVLTAENFAKLLVVFQVVCEPFTKAVPDESKPHSFIVEEVHKYEG